MKLKQSSLAALLLAAAGCSQSDPSTTIGDQVIRVGDPVDLNGDGQPDGVAVDSDGDGKADMVDTNNDGIGDEPLPMTGGNSAGGNNTGTTAGNPDAGGMGSAGNNDGNCQEYVVRNERVTPDMLIVLDRSGSMQSGSVNRWDPSVMAIKDVTSQLDSEINFGLMVFPADDSCGAGDVRVPVGAMTAANIATELDGTEPNGSTPTSDSLAAARMTLGVPPGPDEVPRAKLVLLVTDGSPNCVDVANNCGFFDFQCQLQAAMMLDQAAVDASVAEITAMAAEDIKTYVIGYDTKSDATLASAMDMMAAAGGTGDTQHRAVEDSASLVSTLEEIAGKAVSCNFVLDEAPPDPSYVLITVDGQQVMYDEANGWTLDATDGKKVELKGKACETLQSGGGQHTLSVEVKCEVVQII